MTDQPTKGPQWTGKLGGDGTAFYLRDQQDPENWVVLTGPNREANAKLFIAAQHMDELVEAAEAFDQASEDAEAQDVSGCMTSARERLRAILAKIKGSK
jgi:hypothetical protein